MRGAGDVLRSCFDRLLPAPFRYRRLLTAHHAGDRTGSFTAMPTEMPSAPNTEPLSIHFWTPHAWPSTAIHVGRVIEPLRAEAAALGLRWYITDGPNLPQQPVDWLLCLKTVAPRRTGANERTVLLLNDDADRLWDRLRRFDHVVVVSSPVLASLVGCVHPHVWYVEETEPVAAITEGANALERLPPSQRAPVLLWHGTKESLDGLLPLRDVLDAFAQDTGATLSIVTNLAETTEQWGAMRVRYIPWSPEALGTEAAQARLGIVPARPHLADSYLKSAGRLRCLLALGCPAIGDARSPDVVAFSAACGLPTAHTDAEWLAALRALWRDPSRLDAAARRGHALVRERYSADRTARQWLWFFGAAGTGIQSSFASK
jgi:hypothetical protein